MTSTTMLLAMVLATPVHWEDPASCNNMIQSMKAADYTETYNGLSEDGRDYVIRWKQRETGAIVEEHHNLYPPSQWEDSKTPAYMEAVLSLWIDWDGDGTFGEWFLFPRGEASCYDALHFQWDADLQTYKLYAAGKERT